MRIAFIVVLALAQSSSAGAQLAPGVSVAKGSDVRLTLVSPSQRLRGRFDSTSSDSVYLERGDARMAYAFSSVRRFQIRGGENKKKGFAIGAGIAGGITLVAGGIDYANDRISGDDFVGTVIANILIGGLVGYAFAPKGWIDLPLIP
jgi:hypothetical protein